MPKIDCSLCGRSAFAAALRAASLAALSCLPALCAEPKLADSSPAQVSKAGAEASGEKTRPSPAKKRGLKDEPYRLSFKPGSDILTEAGEKLLSKVVQTLAAFPIYAVRVEAFASKSEKDPETLAKRRAERIRERIVSWKPPKTQVLGMTLKPVDPSLVELSHSVSPAARDAELRLAPLPDKP